MRLEVIFLCVCVCDLHIFITVFAFYITEFQKGRTKLCGAKWNQQSCLPHWRQQDQDVEGESEGLTS